jgi:hypothetical protein
LYLEGGKEKRKKMRGEERREKGVYGEEERKGSERWGD